MSEVMSGSCHCGAVGFEVTVEEGLSDLRRCNCSLCRRKGAIMAAVPLGDLRVVRGEEFLTLYQWNSMVAKHYFCRVCGVYTHHARRSNPDQYGVNVGCLEGVDVFGLGEVMVGDGQGLSLVGGVGEG